MKDNFKLLSSIDLLNYSTQDLRILASYLDIPTLYLTRQELIYHIVSRMEKRYIRHANMNFQCSQDIDIITLDEWDNDTRPDIKITFVNENKNFTECYTMESWNQWISNEENYFANWIEKPNKTLDTEGYGGHPGNKVFLKTPQNNFIMSFSTIEGKGEYIAAPVVSQYRIGNREGTFGIGQIHGQAPGYTIYSIINTPSMDNHEIEEKDRQFLQKAIHRTNQDVTYSMDELYALNTNQELDELRDISRIRDILPSSSSSSSSSSSIFFDTDDDEEEDEDIGNDYQILMEQYNKPPVWIFFNSLFTYDDLRYVIDLKEETNDYIEIDLKVLLNETNNTRELNDRNFHIEFRRNYNDTKVFLKNIRYPINESRNMGQYIIKSYDEQYIMNDDYPIHIDVKSFVFNTQENSRENNAFMDIKLKYITLVNEDIRNYTDLNELIPTNNIHITLMVRPSMFDNNNTITNEILLENIRLLELFNIPYTTEME